MDSLSNNFKNSPDVSNEVCELNVIVTDGNYGQIYKNLSLVVKQTKTKYRQRQKTSLSSYCFSAIVNLSLEW